MKINGYERLIIQAPDSRKALQFYTDALQMPLVSPYTVRFPEGKLLTVQDGGTDRASSFGFTHLCIDTCNADDGWNACLTAGAVPSREDKTPTGDGELYGGFLRCPGMEELELWHVCRGGNKSEPYQPGHLVKALVHAAVTVPDLDAAIAFYEALGIRLKLHWGWGCSMQLANRQELELFPGSGVQEQSGLIEVSFAVENAAAAYETAIAHGGISVEPPQNGRATVLGLGKERIRFGEGGSIQTVDLFDQ